MNIIEQGKAFLQRMRDLAGQSEWAQRRCPHCGESGSQRHGSYRRHPWTLHGRQTVVVQRYRCGACRRTYSPESAMLIRRGWYAREVRRCAVDIYLHGGTSLRRAAELVRSWAGQQERWVLWRPLMAGPPDSEQCHLSASTIERWLDEAGQRVQTTVPNQLAGVTSSGQLLTDGLWARLRQQH